jgi:peptidyl-prolyl cis-trans isomerase B (cyclophilin B)
MNMARLLFHYGLFAILFILPSLAYANQPPTVQAITKTLKEDRTTIVTLKGNDPERKKLSYAIIQPPEHGSVTVVGNKAKYTPNANYTGADMFYYRANDSELDSGSAAVTLIIKSINDRPVAESKNLNAVMGAAATIPLIANDVEGGPFTYRITAKPKKGKVVLNGNIVIYTPNNADFQGTDSFKFKVYDGKKWSKAALITLQVKEIGAVLTKPDCVVFPDEKVVQITGIEPIADNQLKLTTTANSDIADELTVGKLLCLLPGQDSRYAFGLTAKIVARQQQPDNSTTVALEPATLADEVQEAPSQLASIPLNSDNFLGIIAPEATEAASALAASALPMAKAKSMLNEGIVFSNSAAAPAGATTFNVGNEIKLDVAVKLGKLGLDPQKFKPYGSKAEAKFIVSGTLKNLTLTYDYDIGLDGLNAMDMHVAGDMQLDVKLSGGVDVDLGYYSQAWKEVEDAQAKLLGYSGKFSGLETKHKIGKIPVAGLVFSVVCPSSCPVKLWQTQTPLRTANMGGVIVWVYITADGKITLDGEVGARLNGGQLQLGLTKNSGQSIQTLSTLTRNSAANIIEAPYFDGEASAGLRLGGSLDVDFFAFGVYIANAAMDVVGNINTQLITTSPLSYGTQNLGDPWQWTGSACLETKLGAGPILSARIALGYELDAPFMKKSLDGSFAYTGQWPSEEEILIPGRHGIFDGWITDFAKVVCFPATTNGSQDTDGDGLTDLEEYNLGTNPNKPDTDGDGFSDKQEVDADTDPLNSASTPSEVITCPPPKILDGINCVDPVIASVTPVSGTVGQSLTITVTGTNLPLTIVLGIDGQSQPCSIIGRTSREAAFNCLVDVAGTWDLLIQSNSTLNGGVPILSGFNDFTVKNSDPGANFSVVAENDQQIYLSTNLGAIYTWNVTTGTVRQVSHTGLLLTDIAIDPVGRLFGITEDSLYRLDPLTGESLIVGPLQTMTGELFFGVSALNDANGFDISPTGIGRISSGNNTIIVNVDLETGHVNNEFGPLIGYPSSAGDIWYTDNIRYSVTTSSSTIVNVVHETLSSGQKIEDVWTSEFIGNSQVDALIGMPNGSTTILPGTLIGIVGKIAYTLGPGEIALGQGLKTLDINGSVTGAAIRRNVQNSSTNKVRLSTSLGNIVIQLKYNKAPISSTNFTTYVKSGFYNGTIFHRVIPDFVAQGGGYDTSFNLKETNPPIINEADNSLSNKRGTVAMARTGDPHSATSQFFINYKDNLFLDYTTSTTNTGWGYAVFGEVIQGMEVVDEMAKQPTGNRGSHQNVPKINIVIEKAEIID